MNQQNPFKWRHFESEIILLWVRWYLRYALSYRDLEETMRERGRCHTEFCVTVYNEKVLNSVQLWPRSFSALYHYTKFGMASRGLHVDHTTIYRWVQHYTPELDKRSRPQLKACNDSWKVDETSIKVRKTWMYLYRAVDSQGDTLEFLLSATRDAEAAQRFFVKALHSTACSAPQARPLEEQVAQPMALADPITTTSAPRVINVDKNAAYPKAIAELKAAGILPKSVELKPGQILEQPGRARPSLHQTPGQAGNGLLFG